MNVPEFENAGIRIWVDLNIRAGSAGIGDSYRYISTELDIVTVNGTLIS